jgi:hypothetical protein
MRAIFHERYFPCRLSAASNLASRVKEDGLAIIPAATPAAAAKEELAALSLASFGAGTDLY